MSLNILSSKLIEILIVLCFLVFAARIYLKDIFFVLLEWDSIYIRSCRCSDQIDNIYISWSLGFDIFDFLIATFTLYQIFRVVNPLYLMQQNRQTSELAHGRNDDSLASDQALL